jgi:hypothetical protein
MDMTCSSRTRDLSGCLPTRDSLTRRPERNIDQVAEFATASSRRAD